MTILFFSGIAAMSKQYTEPAFKLVDGHGVLFSLHPRYQSAAKNWLKRNCEAFDTGNVSVMFEFRRVHRLEGARTGANGVAVGEGP